MTRHVLTRDGIVVYDYVEGAVPVPTTPADTCRGMVTRLYQEVLHREPDAGGLAYWTQRCVDGTPESEIRAAFLVVAPPPPTPTPPTPPLTSNPGAIQPALGWAVKHVIFPSGYIFGYEVPQIPAEQPGAVSVDFTQGQDANTPGHVTTEYCVSQTPGVIDPNAGPGFYYKTTGASYQSTALWRKAVGRQPFLDPSQKWYINIKWTQPEGKPCGFSLQWALGG